MKPELEAAFELIRKEIRETEPCFCTAGFVGADNCPAEALYNRISRLMGASLARAMRASGAHG